MTEIYYYINLKEFIFIDTSERWTAILNGFNQEAPSVPIEPDGPNKSEGSPSMDIDGCCP